ncbi:MAG: methyltransferase [Gammaproteobacteria bacterium]|nr:methyltransferase [Gammaproteobacteria bacterium]
MSTSRIILAASVVAALFLGGCAGQAHTTADATAAPVTDAATAAAIDRALAGDHRSAANRARDVYRHPKETLTFFGLRNDMTVMEIWPGGGGWYTEVLAPVLRDKGRYIAASWDPKSDSKYVQDNLKAYADKLASRPDLYGKATVAALQYPDEMKPVGEDSVDMVLTFRNLHNWMSREAAEAMLAAMFKALKPGGILGMVEHRASDGVPQDLHAKSGYVREDYAIALAQGAGFELIGRSNVNANPKDTKDYPQGVWTLPPTYREGDANRERYTAIGESDRFTLRFRKPL